MSLVNNNLLLTADAGVAPSAYQISRSLRFNSADSAYCSRVFSTAGNRQTWTWSGWVKRATSNQFQILFSGAAAAFNSWIAFVNNAFGDGDFLALYTGNGSSGQLLYTNSVFRDSSAWYHIQVVLDTTNATESERCIFYVNGIRQTRNGTVSQNWTPVINGAIEHNIGRNTNVGQYFNGYLADVHFIDGQALTPSSFTETNATTGQLVPKDYAGSYGTNGFRLNFSDNSAATAATLGADSSGNGNNWTPNNLSVNAGGQVSISAASGALPVYNTTDAYGAVKGTGTRTDSNASSLVLAIPMDGANNGTTFTDESATIKGSGTAKAITVVGNTKTLTAQSKYYGSSGYFDGTGDYLQCASDNDFAFGTGQYTVEFWLRFATVTNVNEFVSTSTDSNSGRWTIYYNGGTFFTGATGGAGGTTFAFTPSANVWYFLSVTRDASSNQRLFIDGELKNTTTSTNNYTQSGLWVGRSLSASPAYLNGYIQDLRIYKGVAKYTSNFTPPSATQNTTVAAGCDSLTDTPTSYGTDTGAGGEVRGNYATLNPLVRAGDSNPTFTDGNLQLSNSSGGNAFGASSIAMVSGKWYTEFVATVGGPSVGIWIPIVSPSVAFYSSPNTNYRYNTGGGLFNSAGSQIQSYSTWTTGDVIGVALDLDNGKVFFSKNGVWQGSSNPASGTNPAVSGLTGTWTFGGGGSPGNVFVVNFGQRPFAYAAPSGFKALCDTNLPTPTIAKGSSVFDTTLYTGTGAALTPTSSLAFSPDLVWIKGRSGATDHALYDTVRGATFDIISNSTAAETTQTQGLTAFNGNGFSVGTLAKLNTSAATYAAWTWDAGSSTVTNTDGSITSQVRANASAGFSVISWTGTGATGGTIGHGLNVVPEFIICKSRTTATSWPVYHKSLNSLSNFLELNVSASTGSVANYWGSTAFTSNVFNASPYGTSGANWPGASMIAYCFAPVTGYSAFGSYTGNGSADGSFVYTGFRPRWIITKPTSIAGSWLMHDTSRNPYNVSVLELQANDALAEYSTAGVGAGDRFDILSNGFKNRSANPGANQNGVTYIYAAFAENPFQFARAR